MLSINKVILMGFLGRDPELRKTTSGKSVVNFTLATSEYFRDENSETGFREETEWHNVVCWGEGAERFSETARKGDAAFVEGKKRTRDYQTKEGETKYITEIIGVAKLVQKKSDRTQTTEKPKEKTEKQPEPEDFPPSSQSPEDDLPF